MDDIKNIVWGLLFFTLYSFIARRYTVKILTDNYSAFRIDSAIFITECALLPMDTRTSCYWTLDTCYQAASKAEKTRILEEVHTHQYHSENRLRNGTDEYVAQSRPVQFIARLFSSLCPLMLFKLVVRVLLPQIITVMEKLRASQSDSDALRTVSKVCASSIDRLLKEANTTVSNRRNRVINHISKNPGLVVHQA